MFAAAASSGASIDEVAEDAGYTKGAFYANFKSKEELFLAMLDEQLRRALERVDAPSAATATSPGEQAREAGGRASSRYIAADPELGAAVLRVRRLRRAQRGVPRRSWSTPPRSLRGGDRRRYCERRVDELGLEPPMPVRPTSP